MNGIIPLYKERGMTSFDCIARLRRILHTRKIGHAGTLDPNVDGVLPIAIGRATKVIEYLMASGKEYSGELIIGKSTTTEDLSGELLEKQAVLEPISKVKIMSVMQKMTGQLTQIPPMYSAVKVNGKRLYEYARKGEFVDRPVRTVVISYFTLISTSYDEQEKVQRVCFKVGCSKGTYVRTLVAELAKQLGFPGVMSQLTRFKAGGFTLDQTLSLDDIQDMATNGVVNLYPIDYALATYPHQELAINQWQIVQHGGWLKLAEIHNAVPTVVLTQVGLPRAIYKRTGDYYKPEKMLLTEEGGA